MLFKAPLLVLATLALGVIASPVATPIDISARNDFFTEGTLICYCLCRNAAGADAAACTGSCKLCEPPTKN